jgi:lambda family phage portal protein
MAAAAPAPPRRAYDGADVSSAAGRAWTVGDLSATQVTNDAPKMRDRARDLIRNFSWARQVVETFTDDVVGWGPRPLSKSPEVQSKWLAWEPVAGADGESFAQVVSRVVRAVFVDGEAFVRLRPRKEEDGLPVALQLQVLPAEIVADQTEQKADELVVHGVALDKIGRVKGYLMHEVPPGEPGHANAAPKFVPAAGVLHVFDRERAYQRRGIPPLAPVLRVLNDLAAFSRLTVARAAVAAAGPTGVLTTQAEDDPTIDPLTGETVTADEPFPEIRLSAPWFQQAPPGYEPKVFDAPDMPTGYAEFVEAALREVGAALGVPVEVFTSRWGATNDRLARVVLAQYRRRIERFIWTVLEPQLLRPVWLAWREAAGYPKAEAEWMPQAWPYINPLQDVASQADAIRNGLTSLRAALSERGLDIETVLQQIAEDQKLADKYGVKLATDGRQQQKGGAQ